MTFDKAQDRVSTLGRALMALSLVLALALGGGGLKAHADEVALSVSATSAGSKVVGAEANVWGAATGFSGPVQISTQVKINGQWSTSQIRSSENGSYAIPLTYGASASGVNTWRVVAVGEEGTATSEEFDFRRYSVTVGSAGTKYVGDTTFVWGSVQGFSGPVTVRTQVLLNDKWSTSQMVTVDSGSYKLPLTYGMNSAGTYKFRVHASSSTGETATTKGFSFTRVSKPTVSAAAAASKKVGETSYAWGSVSGFSGPATVLLQVKVNGKWSTSRVAKNVTGSYTLPLAYGQNTEGTHTYRVVAQRAGEPTAFSSSFTQRRTANLDSRCLTGRAICISKTTRQLHWVVDGKIQMSMDVRFGSEMAPTREGRFQVNWKSRNHVSSLYHTPMPFALFFSGGQAVHYSPDFAANGYNGASHGCVNVRDRAKVEKLFDLSRVGDKVIVYW